jgi:hypothetical protein
MTNPEGVEYRGITVPVKKLDREDKRLVRQTIVLDAYEDGLGELRTEVFQSSEAYQAYKGATLRARSLMQETLPGKARVLKGDVEMFARDLFIKVKPTPRRGA